ncbi:hypothetical protein C0J52_24296 [Blattella germanica]|nr:hypothetical protein C0J52_24296 [Blattella germanica]
MYINFGLVSKHSYTVLSQGNENYSFNHLIRLQIVRLSLTFASGNCMLTRISLIL